MTAIETPMPRPAAGSGVRFRRYAGIEEIPGMAAVSAAAR